MYRLRLWPLPFALSLLILIASVPPKAAAQASTTASKTQDISVFGGLEFANPEYGPDSNTGGALGADFTRYFRHLPVAPSLELRANFNDGPYANESSYLFGLRAGYGYSRYTPYVDFLVGPGNIHYPRNVGYTGDNSIVYDYGGGLEIDLVRNFSLKLDVQQQRWNTGTFTFTPVTGIVGVTYHIPFRSQVGYTRHR